MSQSHALAVTSPAGMEASAASCLTAAPDITALLDNHDIYQSAQLEYPDSAESAWRARISLLRPDIGLPARQPDLEIILPPRKLAARDIALLPGGAVTVRGPDAILVCDPAEAIGFNATEAKRLHRGLSARADVSTLSHNAKGIVLCARVPRSLPPQAVTIVPDATKLPVRTSLTGPVLIQWGVRGAVAWPLVPAPAAFAVAASIAASPLINNGQGLVNSGSAIAPETWYAEDVEARTRLIAPALAEHLSDVLSDTVADDQRLALMDACVDGRESLAWRIADMLAMLPSCFLEDHVTVPGAPPAEWRRGLDCIRDAPDNLALLGLDNVFAPAATIRALRDVIENANVLAFAENGDILPSGPADLHSDFALSLARAAGARGRLGVTVPVPASPVDLYALAHEAAEATGRRIIAVAPCWGFCHRIDPDGEEAGNAGWFGMGAGLDEVDALLADFEHRA